MNSLENTWQATYFDGRTSAAQRAQIRVEDDAWVIETVNGETRIDQRATRWTSDVGNSTRTLSLANGGCLVVDGMPSIDDKTSSIDRARRSRWHERLSHSTWAVALAALLLASAFSIGYVRTVPWVSTRLAQALPERTMARIADRALEALDGMGLTESTLPAAQRTAIVKDFFAMTPPDNKTKVRQIIFKSAPKIGPNAIALPDGTMIVTDELVRLARDRKQVMAVMSHELAHVAHRHGAALIVEGGLVAAFLSMYLGDFSPVASLSVSALATNRYSRKAELAADDYAVAMMKKNGIAPTALSTILARMDHQYRALERLEDEAQTSRAAQLEAYFSSHPTTAERVRRIEAVAR